MIWNYYVAITTEGGGYKLRPSIAKLRPIHSVRAKQSFIQGFCADYSYFVQEFMAIKDAKLDRHKVTAIAMINLMRIDMFKNPPKQDDRLSSFPQQEIAIDVGLSFMLDQLNYELKERLRLRNELPKYNLPYSFSTEAPYAQMLARELCLTQKRYMLNPIALADKLFMIEYITLLSNNINPECL